MKQEVSQGSVLSPLLLLYMLCYHCSSLVYSTPLSYYLHFHTGTHMHITPFRSLASRTLTLRPTASAIPRPRARYLAILPEHYRAFPSRGNLTDGSQQFICEVHCIWMCSVRIMCLPGWPRRCTFCTLMVR